MKKIILMGTPHHDNLGDVAIAYAEKKFIKENFSEYELVCVTEEKIKKLDFKEEIKNITDDNIIFLHGGGNFGNQYLEIENARRKIIQLFPNNKIIMFPQTIYFTPDEEGKRELEISKEIYSKHKNLIITPREKKSLKIIEKEFKDNEILYLPDIVTYLNEIQPRNRKGALLILRNDKEKNREVEDENVIENALKKHFDKIERTDLSKGEFFGEEYLENKVQEMLEKYRNAEIVVTDRLHGMIFAMITGTPCIALKNYNYKVESFYGWFEKLNYIEFLSDVNDFESKLEKLEKLETIEYSDSYRNEFKKLVEKIRNYQ